MASLFCHGSGIIIRMACGSDRPAITSSSSTLSKIALSLPPSRTIGSDLLQILAEQIGLEQRLARLHPVDVAAQRVDLAVVRDEAVGMGQRPRRERVGAEALVHQRQRRLERRIAEIGEHAPDLLGGQHALVDQRPRRQADDVEELPLGDLERVNGVLDALADHEQLALERRVALARNRRRGQSGTAADEDLPEHRLDRHRARTERAVVGRHLAPADEALPFLDDDPLEQLDDRRTAVGVVRQEHEPGAVPRPLPAAPSRAGWLPGAGSRPASESGCRRRRRC